MLANEKRLLFPCRENRLVLTMVLPVRLEEGDRLCACGLPSTPIGPLFATDAAARLEELSRNGTIAGVSEGTAESAADDETAAARGW